ncbi:O-antigen ligase family protein [Flavobacteriaceae bacterium S0825]|uniref:O-antigen ligase family protein n=1 Tax=Gaetbulibacter sp. S0825 TaxID=2720084 RepID=UPI00142F6CC3|nr:O-antigen ligase family protein [Gaetbulibacter sp. S0825]MCK0109042.1 O-antigen ligase family protein [Flavobacteriaceae bacterium S0825]NIX64677.1 O-antigen ligase family protein [Gaetbulibacter sp. S0825]
MQSLSKKNSELIFILLHIALGLVIYYIPFSSKLVSLLVVFLSIFLVLLSKNKVLAVLIACAYVATSDVFFRMTGGLFFYELHKYLLIVLVFIGFIFDQVRVKGQVYLMYVALLLLTIVFTAYDYTDEVRKMIAFNLAGPVSLGFVAFYFYKKKITMQQLSKVLFFALLPIISLVVYLFLYTPSIKDSVTGTASNFATSGGFGPNQVATILGVGMFILFSRLLFNKFRGIQSILELLLFGYISFRGLVTFSRGGIITAIVAIIFLIALTYLRGHRKFRSKVLMVIFWSIILGVSVWFYASNRTSGLIENRYANQNAVGVEKQDVSTGRKDLFLTEVEAFVESPIIGIGVGKNKGYRFDKTGKVAASHNEISRLLAEHGSLGIIALSILLLVPLLLRIENNRNIYFYSFFIMWLLTINHSAMRIAFPSFIYGLCLLDVTFPKKTSLKKQVA